MAVQTPYLGPAQSFSFSLCIVGLQMSSDLERLHVLQCKRKQYNVLAEHLAQWGCYLLRPVSTALGNMINKLDFNCRTHVATQCLVCQGMKWKEDPHLPSLVYDHTLFA